MTDRLAGGSHRRFWRIGWLICGIAAAIGLLAAVPALGQAARDESPLPNPPLTARCGLKVMLVLDESNSIYTGFGTPPGRDFYTADVRNAATGFVQALKDTGSPLAITAFHSFSRAGVPEAETSVGYEPVTGENISQFTDWINNDNQPEGVTGYRPVPTSQLSASTQNPFGTTNWEDAFDEVDRTTDGPPNLVVFVTDGDPNR